MTAIIVTIFVLWMAIGFMIVFGILTNTPEGEIFVKERVQKYVISTIFVLTIVTMLAPGMLLFTFLTSKDNEC